MAFHSEISGTGRSVLRFAADCLDDLSSRMGNAVCNDWAWPEWMPPEIRDIIMEQVRADCGGEFDGDVPFDFMAVGAAARLLRSMC